MRLKTLVILLSISVLVFGQTNQKAIQIIEKINAHYSSQNINMETTYLLYDGLINQATLVSQFKATIYRKGNLSYSKMKEQEVIKAQAYNLFVDHKKKMIMLSAKQGTVNNEGSFRPDKGLVKILDLCKEVKLKENQIIFVKPKTSQYKKIVVWYTPDYQLEKMAMYGSAAQNSETGQIIQQPIMVIEMKTLGHVNADPYLNYSRFLEKRNGKLELKSSYLQYQFKKRGLDL